MSALQLLNSDFQGTTAVARQQFVTAVASSILVDTGIFDSGTQSVRWNPVLASGISTVELVPGPLDQATIHVPSTRGVHTFSLRARTGPSAAATIDHRLVLRLQHFSADGELLSEESARWTGTPVTGSFQTFTVRAEPVTGTAYVQPLAEVELTGTDTGLNFYFDSMSLDAEPEAVPPGLRHVLADAASSVDGVSVAPYWRQATRPGSGAVHKTGVTYEAGRFGLVRWQVLVVMPADVESAQRYLDEQVVSVTAALSEHMTVVSMTPIQQEVSPGKWLPVASIEGTREEE